MSDIGKGIALTAKVYSFRPSIAMGVEGLFEQIIFDTMAATVATEVEAQASDGSYGGQNVPNLSWDAQRKAQDRVREQEELVKQLNERRGNS